MKVYILMRGDESGRNLAYLYDTAHVTESVGIGRSAVNVVEVEAGGEERALYLANYQLGRLQSGMEARSDRVFRSSELAHAEAIRVSERLSVLR